MNSDKLIEDLQTWYEAQCDGDWEHDYGVSITTLDNPGWGVKINLYGTILENKVFEEIVLEDGQGWIDCRVIDNQFRGYSNC